MERLLYIIPECYVDTNLISTLINAAVNHQKCCTKVTETLNKTFSDNFAVGIIDRVLIIDSAAEIGLDLNAYELSSDLNALKKFTKKVSSNVDSKFTKLFRDLRASSDFTVLFNALNYLIENKFKSKIEDLKIIFA